MNLATIAMKSSASWMSRSLLKFYMKSVASNLVTELSFKNSVPRSVGAQSALLCLHASIKRQLTWTLQRICLECRQPRFQSYEIWISQNRRKDMSIILSIKLCHLGSNKSKKLHVYRRPLTVQAREREVMLPHTQSLQVTLSRSGTRRSHSSNPWWAARRLGHMWWLSFMLRKDLTKLWSKAECRRC